MSEEDKTLMAEYGITSTVKKVYTYKEYRYDRHLRCAQLCAD
jgi:hypothetical protein